MARPLRRAACQARDRVFPCVTRSAGPAPLSDRMALAIPPQARMPASLQPPSQPPPQSPGAIDTRIAAAARGDRAAAQALLTELLPRVRNLVRYLVRGDRDVDDIAQEALIAIACG